MDERRERIALGLMRVTRSTMTKLTLVGALYLSQGLPYGFFTQALPVMMRQSGRSLEQIGLASLLALPWALKFLWAPFVDRHGSKVFGMRKSWIVPLRATLTGGLTANTEMSNESRVN